MSPDAVIKVGGSLLDWPELPAKLATYLERRAGQRVVLIAGGGPAADVVRRCDRVFGLGEERAHHLALQALDLTTHLLASLAIGLQAVDETSRIAAVWDAGLTPVLAPRRFLEEDERGTIDAIPHSWDVTSDSIAAHVAHRLGAPSLVLLKSAPLPCSATPESAARAGLVDPYFPTVAQRLEQVLLVNLRDPRAAALRLDRSLDGR